MDAQPETTTPIEEKHSFNWQAFILWPFLILVLYVLSLGPVEMMTARGIISSAPGDSVNELLYGFYTPLRWAYGHKPLHKPLGMYLHLWAPRLFDKNGDHR
jgi:hypothetical protein